MSFSRSGNPGPGFSYPVGTGVFTDVIISNSLITSNIFFSVSNIAVQQANVGTLQANVFYGGGNTLSNLQFSNLTGFQSNTLSNLNASNLAFGVVNSSLIFGNTLGNLQFSNVTGLLPNTISNLNASNLAFGVVNSSLIFGNTISNINSSNVTQPFTNLLVSNTLTTTNLVAAGFTSNSSNTIFNYSTLTVPFVVATTLNVSSTSNLGQVASSGQVVATGKSGVGVCPPIVYRQGGSATTWNSPGANTSTYAITSGAVQIQCGANVMSGTTQFIPFPVAYTNNPIVLVTSYSTTGNIWVSSITATNFQVQANVVLQFEWLSIGI